jgi:peroxiredoxin
LAANNSSPTLNMQASPGTLMTHSTKQNAPIAHADRTHTHTQRIKDLRGLPLVLAFHAPRVCVDCGRESSVQV